MAKQQAYRSFSCKPPAQEKGSPFSPRPFAAQARRISRTPAEARDSGVKVRHAVAGHAPVQRVVKPEELEFMTDEELLKVLESLSLVELLRISMALKELYKSSDPKPRHLGIVETYKAKKLAPAMEEIEEFAARTGYIIGRSFGVHELFGNLTLSLYPEEGKNPKAGEKTAHRPHRPILDVEFVGDDPRPYARNYLGLYATAPDSRFKDITSDDSGNITLKDIGLMNLGNPFKALLWCEDYLTNQEHYKNSDEKPAPKPVVRSFLIPLAEATGLLLSEGDFSGTRPLDQDRGSGQFGNLGDANVYAKVLHPLIGSLVSFFHDKDEYAKASDKGQKKYGLVNLQEYLTGQRGDPRSITKGGIAAQHGRLEYEAEFAPEYADVMQAYYESVDPEKTEFTGATKGDAATYRKSNKIPSIFDDFPLIKREIGQLSSGHLSGSGARFQQEDPPKLPPSLVRLRAFLQAYGALPGGGGGGGNGEEAEASGKEAEKSDRVKEQPKTLEPKGSEPSKPSVDPESSSKKPEKENPGNQYVQNAGGPVIPASWFQLLLNPGGGDCLFHALEGRTLNGVEMLEVRGRVGTIRRRTPDTPLGPNYNANVVAATILQTPTLRRFAPLVAGRNAVPNRVLALLQSIPGVYAGPEELVQWCQLRNRTVYVVDRDGSVVEYSAAGSRLMFTLTAGLLPRTRARRLQSIRGLIEAGRQVLYKSPAHWELIQGVSGTFGQAPAEDQEKAKKKVEKEVEKEVEKITGGTKEL